MYIFLCDVSLVPARECFGLVTMSLDEFLIVSTFVFLLRLFVFRVCMLFLYMC